MRQTQSLSDCLSRLAADSAVISCCHNLRWMSLNVVFYRKGRSYLQISNEYCHAHWTDGTLNITYCSSLWLIYWASSYCNDAKLSMYHAALLLRKLSWICKYTNCFVVTASVVMFHCRRSSCGEKATSWGRACLIKRPSPPSALKAPPSLKRLWSRSSKWDCSESAAHAQLSCSRRVRVYAWAMHKLVSDFPM